MPPDFEGPGLEGPDPEGVFSSGFASLGIGFLGVGFLGSRGGARINPRGGRATSLVTPVMVSYNIKDQKNDREKQFEV